MTKPEILYEDQDLLVAVKPAGVDSEAAGGLAPDMVNLVRSYLAAKPGRTEKGAPYVGLIQRLDRPVSGLMVLAKNRETAGKLSKALQQKQIRKTYRALLAGKPEQESGLLEDWLLKEPRGNRSRTAKAGEAGAKMAELKYRLLGTAEKEGKTVSEVEIELLTGRHHQIRVQFSSRGLPLLGDRKYGPGESAAVGTGAGFGENDAAGTGGKEEIKGREIRAYGGLCLCACRLAFRHPTTNKLMEFSVEPPFSLE